SGTPRSALHSAGDRLPPGPGQLSHLRVGMPAHPDTGPAERNLRVARLEGAELLLSRAELSLAPRLVPPPCRRRHGQDCPQGDQEAEVGGPDVVPRGRTAAFPPRRPGAAPPGGRPARPGWLPTEFLAGGLCPLDRAHGTRGGRPGPAE